ncbi:integrase family protein, partial [Lasius niger]
MEQVENKPWLGEAVDRRKLSDPTATTFTAKDFAHYCDKRLSGEIYFSEKWKNGAEPVTVNLEQSYLSGMFSELARLGEWNQPNPLENM